MSKNKLLEPCNPCVAPGAPCEQCMFGYRSAKDNHKHMKELLEAVLKGEHPIGWGCAARYMEYHADWKEQMNYETEEPKMNDRELRKNAEGYDDPTAYKAIKNIEREQDPDAIRVNKLMGCIFRVCELAGFHVEERIVVKDLRTGKVWR